MKSYFTFGQVHSHAVDGTIFDKDCVVEVEAPDEDQARLKMIEAFGQKWAFQYSDLNKVDLRYYSRGVIPLEKPSNPMMACGHAANATMKLPTGDVPCCAICVTSEQETLPVDLTGRISKCSQCDRTKPSSTDLPFFKHWPNRAFDSHDDMCRGCD